MTEHWRTKEDIAAARSRFQAVIPGWQDPYAYGLGLATPDNTDFPVVNVGAHYLPAVILGVVCDRRTETAVYPLTTEQLHRAIRLLEPAEACPDYDHPNLAAWREIRTQLDHTPGTPIAVFIANPEDPVVDEHDARFRSHLPTS